MAKDFKIFKMFGSNRKFYLITGNNYEMARKQTFGLLVQVTKHGHQWRASVCNRRDGETGAQSGYWWHQFVESGWKKTPQEALNEAEEELTAVFRRIGSMASSTAGMKNQVRMKFMQRKVTK